jgi:hypothetical protein
MRRMLVLILATIMMIACCSCLWGVDREGHGDRDRGMYGDRDRREHGDPDRGGHEDRDKGGYGEHEERH